MLVTKSIAAIAGLAAFVAADLNTTQSFHLVSRVRSGQSGKDDLDNLYLTAYHSGAGQSRTHTPCSNETDT